MGLVVLLSITKDVIMFHFTWRSYIVYSKEDYSRVKEKTGIATKDIIKTGHVNINGELWKVDVNKPVKKGERLVIKKVTGLTLYAEKE